MSDYDWREDVSNICDVFPAGDQAYLYDRAVDVLMAQSEGRAGDVAGGSYYDEDDERMAMISTIGALMCISKDGPLVGLLEEWHGQSGRSMEEAIRGFFEDDDFVYFAVWRGDPYPTYSCDLLGEQNDDLTEDEFDLFVEERIG